MALIPNLSTSATFSASDQLIMAQSNQNNAQRVSGDVVAAYILGLIGSNFTAQYAAPSSTGFTTTVTQTNDNYWLILTPTGGFAAGTIVLPLSTIATDKQIVQVTCTQSIAALTINGNGATVTGEPSAIDGFTTFTLQYDAITSTWYLVGLTAAGGGGESETIQHEDLTVTAGETTLTCDAVSSNIWAICTASDSIETLNIVLPAASVASDGQEVLVSLDIPLAGDGGSIVATSTGATIQDDGGTGGEDTYSLKYKYDQTNTIWIRVDALQAS